MVVTVLSGPATINNNLVTVTGLGAVTLAANQPGGALYSAAPQVTTSFNVVQAPQTIGPLATIPTKEANAAPFTIPVPKSTSGLLVSLSVSRPGHA